MQYTSDGFDPRARIRRRMMDGLDEPPVMDPVQVSSPLTDPQGMPRSGNTGVAGALPRGPAQPAAPASPSPAPPAPAAPLARSAQNMPQGVDREKWLSGHVSPKYAWKEVGQQHNLGTQAGRDAALAQLKAQYPQYFANAAWTKDDMLSIGGDLHRDFQGLSEFDVIRDVDGDAQVRWGTPEQDAINRQIASQQQAGQAPQRGIDPMLGSQRGMDTTQTSLIDEIRAAIMQLMGQGAN